MGATTAPGWRRAVQASPLLGRVANYGAANRGTHFSRPHLPGAIGRSMNCHVRARLMLRTKLLRCRRTDACYATVGFSRRLGFFPADSTVR